MPRILLYNARIATMNTASDCGLLDDAALLVQGDRIEWIGPASDYPRGADIETIDCQGHLITPGLIDCHTHLIYGGDRADEFEQRLEGLSYSEIAKLGGGIQSTVTATRAASEAELLAQAEKRLKSLIAEGVTTVEIKSGYGLELESEMKMLRVAGLLGQRNAVRVSKTFLGAHALPKEYSGESQKYIEYLCQQVLPLVQQEGLVDAVDIFIESIAFNLEEARQVFEAASKLELPVKAHADQLSYTGASLLACEYNALSVDHIEYLPACEVENLAKKSTVAVLLPGAFYVLREQQLPPVEALRQFSVPLAIATDANPGSSPIFSILLIMNMACSLFGMTPTEALRGVTINAARALGLDAQIGSLEIGKQADLVIWDVKNPAKLSYQMGINPCLAVMFAGCWRKTLMETGE